LALGYYDFAEESAEGIDADLVNVLDVCGQFVAELFAGRRRRIRRFGISFQAAPDGRSAALLVDHENDKDDQCTDCPEGGDPDDQPP
jgi:hypothetical protein